MSLPPDVRVPQELDSQLSATKPPPTPAILTPSSHVIQPVDLGVAQETRPSSVNKH